MTAIFSKAIPESNSLQGYKNHTFGFIVIKNFQVSYGKWLNHITSLVVFYQHRVNSYNTNVIFINI